MTTASSLNKRYGSLSDRLAKLNSNLEKLQKEAKDSGKCDHSSSYEYELKSDYGYGSWYTTKYRYCPLCKTKFYFYITDWREIHREDEK